MSRLRKGVFTLLVLMLIVIFAALALSGCVLLPIPWPSKSPLCSPEQIAKIREGYSSRDEVISLLGVEADIQRLDGRYWVYHWKKDSGMWFAVPLLPLVAGDSGPIISKQFILFLEFDEKGILLSKQFGNKTADKYCTASGFCLEHEVHVGYLNSGAFTYDFHNMESAFMVNGSAKDSVPWPALGGDRFVVVLWPDAQDWKDLKGLRLAIGDPPQDPPSWLPVGCYLTLSLPAGQQTVRVTNPWSDPLFDIYNKSAVDSVANFYCEAGQTVYMEIEKISKRSGGLLGGERVSIVLRTIDPDTGRQVIAEMPRLLSPETKTR
jgi:outer membrane protein assembly factor BamE (lipoprotein component of BamABCDE complex)